MTNFVTFLSGDTRVIFDVVSLGRINFAYLDATHNVSEVMNELSHVSKAQLPGDVIVLDDYDVVNFPGVVTAVDEFVERSEYRMDLIEINGTRCFAVLEKLR